MEERNISELRLQALFHFVYGLPNKRVFLNFVDELLSVIHLWNKPHHLLFVSADQAGNEHYPRGPSGRRPL